MDVFEILVELVSSIFKRRFRRFAVVRRPAAGSAAPAAPAAAAPAPVAAPLAAPAAAAAPPPLEPPAPIAAPPAPAEEAGLVTGLFASPRTLAAAMIAAEILAKPVALRER